MTHTSVPQNIDHYQALFYPVTPLVVHHLIRQRHPVAGIDRLVGPALYLFINFNDLFRSKMKYGYRISLKCRLQEWFPVTGVHLPRCIECQIRLGYQVPDAGQIADDLLMRLMGGDGEVVRW